MWEKVVFGGLSVWTLADCEWRTAAVGVQAKPKSKKSWLRRLNPTVAKKLQKQIFGPFLTVENILVEFFLIFFAGLYYEQAILKSSLSLCYSRAILKSSRCLFARHSEMR